MVGEGKEAVKGMNCLLYYAKKTEFEEDLNLLQAQGRVTKSNLLLQRFLLLQSR